MTVRTVPIAAGRTVTTRHGLHLRAHPADISTPDVDRLLVPGARAADEVNPEVRRWATDHRLVVELPHAERAAGEGSFDPMLCSLAAHTDRATARTSAKYIEYPTGHLQLAGGGWPWRPTALLALTVAAALGLAVLPGVPDAGIR